MKKQGRKPHGRIIVCVGAIVSLILSGCTGSSATEDEAAAQSIEDMEPITLSVPDISGPGSPAVESIQAYLDEVENRTGGKIEFELYPSSSLMEGNEMLSGIGSGAADMGRLVSSYTVQELPVLNWYNDTAGMDTEPAFLESYLQSAVASHVTHLSDGPLRDELEAHNLTPLSSVYGTPNADMLCTEPVNNPQDLSGLQIRATGEAIINELEDLGGSSVPMPLGEVYEALQRGVIDCAVLEPASHISFGLWEVAKHYVPLRLSAQQSLPFVINTDVWNSLPAEAQEIMRESTIVLLDESTNQNLLAYQRFATEGVEEFGIVFEDVKDLTAVVIDHQESRYRSLPDTAPNEVSDPESFTNELVRTKSSVLELLQDVPDTAFPDLSNVNGSEGQVLRAIYEEASEVDLEGFWNGVESEFLTTSY